MPLDIPKWHYAEIVADYCGFFFLSPLPLGIVFPAAEDPRPEAALLLGLVGGACSEGAGRGGRGCGRSCCGRRRAWPLAGRPAGFGRYRLARRRSKQPCDAVEERRRRMQRTGILGRRAALEELGVDHRADFSVPVPGEHFDAVTAA